MEIMMAPNKKEEKLDAVLKYSKNALKEIMLSNLKRNSTIEEKPKDKKYKIKNDIFKW